MKCSGYQFSIDINCQKCVKSLIPIFFETPCSSAPARSISLTHSQTNLGDDKDRKGNLAVYLYK